mgnify:FL=1|jgi:hypothetical protein
MFTESFLVTKYGVHQKYPSLEVPIVCSNPRMIRVFPGMAAFSTIAKFHQVYPRPRVETKTSANIFQVIMVSLYGVAGDVLVKHLYCSCI